ncbi:MAG: hypothetical protein JNG88_00400 [Phycisphaerales bacterium]|nr:hypothetical protein [Phycisphaerales bacterium]
MFQRISRMTFAAAVSAISAAASADTFQVEIDYMGADGDGHDHRPPQIVIDAVVQMFACQGHTLVIDLDDEIPHYATLIGDPTNDCSNFWNYTGAANTYRSIRNTYRDRGEGWHYCLFAHAYSTDDDNLNNGSGCQTSGSSGLANGGDCFIVTLGTFPTNPGTPIQQAGTLAHELGHNLGLSHCGVMNCGNTTEYIQNMPSIMAYTYQLGGVRNRIISLGYAPEYALFKELDYSHGRLCALNENSLSELNGTRMRRVDFNCDNDTDDVGVVQDLGFSGIGSGNSAPWCGNPNTNLSVISDYDEWGNLSDGAGLVADADRGNPYARQILDDRLAKMQTCITSQEWVLIEAEMGGPAGGIDLEVEDCIGGENVYVSSTVNFPNATCFLPIGGIQNAQFSSPNNSVYYLYPGTFNEAGMTTLNKPGIWSCNTGLAQIR